MSELNELHDYENRPKKKNPFRSKPIPKSRIEWAIRSTMSIKAAARYLGIAYNTFKKYAIMYDLFEQNKNQAGVGITTKGNTGWGVKLQERVVRDGFLKQECSNCGYDDYREKDMRGPYMICFLDGDSKNHSLDNLHLLCYNCFYIMKPTGKMLTTPKNTTLLRKKLEEVWVEKDDE